MNRTKNTWTISDLFPRSGLCGRTLFYGKKKLKLVQIPRILQIVLDLARILCTEILGFVQNFWRSDLQLWTNNFWLFWFWKQQEKTSTNLEITGNSKYSSETSNSWQIFPANDWIFMLLNFKTKLLSAPKITVVQSYLSTAVVPRKIQALKEARASSLFFLSLFLKTQANHWTKRIVNTQLIT